jgi:hypothetical protein
MAWDDNAWESNGDEASGDDDHATSPCPYCGRSICDDSERCPYCGNYISTEDAPSERKPWWVIMGTILCLYVVYRWIIG